MFATTIHGGGRIVVSALCFQVYSKSCNLIEETTREKSVENTTLSHQWEVRGDMN